MKKFALIAGIIALITGSVVYLRATTTTLFYTEAGSNEVKHITVSPGNFTKGWSHKDCYLHISYRPALVNNEVVPNKAIADLDYELSTGAKGGRAVLSKESKKIHIVSIL